MVYQTHHLVFTTDWITQYDALTQHPPIGNDPGISGTKVTHTRLKRGIGERMRAMLPDRLVGVR